MMITMSRGVAIGEAVRGDVARVEQGYPHQQVEEDLGLVAAVVVAVLHEAPLDAARQGVLHQEHHVVALGLLVGVCGPDVPQDVPPEIQELQGQVQRLGPLREVDGVHEQLHLRQGVTPGWCRGRQ